MPTRHKQDVAESLSPFAAAQRQLDQAAEQLGFEPAVREMLRWPQRELSFTLPVHLDDGSVRLFHACRVLYNSARGPCHGGVRWHPDETLDNARAEAASMSWKTACLDLPLGGSSGSIACNPKELSDSEKQRLARAYVRALADWMGAQRDVPAPDIYTTPQVMAWMMDEYETIVRTSSPGAITGKPLLVGGSAGRGDAVARGAVFAVREAMRATGMRHRGAFAIHGFGNAGRNIALLHPDLLNGGRLVAVADSEAGIFNSEGLDPVQLVDHKQATGSVKGFRGAKEIAAEALLELDVDVLYPASLGGVITARNAVRIKARIICEVANGALASGCEQLLQERRCDVIPDLLANSGGVTVSHFEQVQNASNNYWPAGDVNRQLDDRMTNAYRAVYAMSQKMSVPMRNAAYLLGVERVAQAMRLRGWI